MAGRYIKQQQLPGFGIKAQQKLAEAKVLVTGAGGLGVPVLQYLCGMGIGTIGIIDGDVVDITNLHRQVLYSEADIGKKKASVAAQKLQQLNSNTIIHVYDEMLTAANAVNIIAHYDLVIDATDNFTARYLVNDVCVIIGKPFVYAAIQGWEAQLSVFNYKDGPTYRCLYPQQPSPLEIPDCNTAGVLGVLPGIVGCRQALEAIKIITGIGYPLSGYLKIFDFGNDTDYKIKLAANPANKNIKALQEGIDISCSATGVNELSPFELCSWYQEGKEFMLIDVREVVEFNDSHLQHALNVPLAEIAGKDFSVNTPVVLFCKTGNRSRRAASLVKEQNNILQVYNLTGGFDNWAATMNNQLIET